LECELKVFAGPIAARVIRGARVAVITGIIIVGIDASEHRITEVVGTLITIVTYQHSSVRYALRLLAGAGISACISIIARCAVYKAGVEARLIDAGISGARVSIIALAVFRACCAAVDELVVATCGWVAEIVCTIVRIIAICGVTGRTLRLLAGAGISACISIIARCAVYKAGVEARLIDAGISGARVCIVALAVFRARCAAIDELVVATCGWVAEIVCTIVRIIAICGVTGRTLRLLAGAGISACIAVITRSTVD
jgi:hypothetical protein